MSFISNLINNIPSFVMEDFVPFEIAKKLNKKGFKELCLVYYTNDNTLYYNYSHKAGACHTDCYFSHNLMPKDSVSGKFVDAPTISQVLKWLRKEKKIFIAINIGYCYESYEIPFPTNPEMEPILKGYCYGIWELDNLNDKNGHSEYFEAPEKAALAGIEYVIDNLI